MEQVFLQRMWKKIKRRRRRSFQKKNSLILIIDENINRFLFYLLVYFIKKKHFLESWDKSALIHYLTKLSKRNHFQHLFQQLWMRFEILTNLIQSWQLTDWYNTFEQIYLFTLYLFKERKKNLTKVFKLNGWKTNLKRLSCFLLL